jgi:plastocyanin
MLDSLPALGSMAHCSMMTNPVVGIRQRRWVSCALALAACGSAPETAPPLPEAKPQILGKAPPATGGYPSVIMLTPDVPLEAPAAGEPALMDQYGTAFWPKLLVVRPGQPVDFKNSEDVLHNVHVIDAETRKTEFNVGTPLVGAYRHTFRRDGAYDVSCNIHPSMGAFLIVTSAPYFVVADSKGTFAIDGIPEGTYVARVWNLDPKRRSERTIGISGSTDRLNFTDS